MKNRIVVCNEIGRKIAYCRINGQIYRREIYNLKDLLSKMGLMSYEEGIKRGLIIEVVEDNIELQEYRSLFVKQQLEGDFIDNLTNPIDDNVICQELFELRVGMGKKPKNIRIIRLKNDPEVNYISASNWLSSEVKVFSALLNNPHYLKSLKFDLSEKCIQQLMLNANDLDYLQRIMKPFFERSDDSFGIYETEESIKKKNDLSREKHASIYPELFAFDTKDIIKLKQFYLNFMDYTTEHLGSPSNKYDYDARIYFNIHDEEIMLQFLEVYISECIKLNISYNIKGLHATDNILQCDTSVFYTKFEDLKSHIKIIEEILLRHPEWRKSFSQPVYGTSRFGTGFYGVSHAGGKTSDTLFSTYNDYYNYILNLSYYCMLAKVLIQNNLINKADDCWEVANILYNFKDLTIAPENTAVKSIKFKSIKEGTEKRIWSAVSLLDKYVTPFVNQKILLLGYEEFRDYMYKFHALCQHLPLDTRMDLAVNSEMNDFFNKTKKDSFENPNLSTKKVNISSSHETLFWKKCKRIIEFAKQPELYSAITKFQLRKLVEKIEKASSENFNETHLNIEKEIDILLKRIDRQNVNSDFINGNLESRIGKLTYEIRQRYLSAKNSYKELIPMLRECISEFGKISSSNINDDIENVLKEFIHCYDSYVKVFNTDLKEKNIRFSKLKSAFIELKKVIHRNFTLNNPIDRQIANSAFINGDLESRIGKLTYEIRQRYLSAKNSYKELILILRECISEFGKISSSNINDDIENVLKEFIHCYDSYVKVFNTDSKEKNIRFSKLKSAFIELKKVIRRNVTLNNFGNSGFKK